MEKINNISLADLCTINIDVRISRYKVYKLIGVLDSLKEDFVIESYKTSEVEDEK